jgi:hypothetical protein
VLQRNDHHLSAWLFFGEQSMRVRRFMRFLLGLELPT